MASNRKITIGNVSIEEHPSASDNFYLLKNPSELFSQLSTRVSDTTRQGGHGVESSLSYYGPRDLPFQIHMKASSRDQMVTMEQNLRKALFLPIDQSYAGDDGVKLVQFIDEDGIGKQIYARVIDPPQLETMEVQCQKQRLCSFELRGDDPILYAQVLTSLSGPESFETTPFTIQDGALPTFNDDELPVIQDQISTSLEADNAGIYGSPPVIIVNGPTLDPVVRNTTTGRTMAFTKNGGLSLLANETLTINVSSQTIIKTDENGATTDESGKLSDDSNWIFIESGVNVFKLQDETADSLIAQLQVQFRSAWN